MFCAPAQRANRSRGGTVGLLGRSDADIVRCSPGLRAGLGERVPAWGNSTESTRRKELEPQRRPKNRAVFGGSAIVCRSPADRPCRGSLAGLRRRFAGGNAKPAVCRRGTFPTYGRGQGHRQAGPLPDAPGGTAEESVQAGATAVLARPLRLFRHGDAAAAVGQLQLFAGARAGVPQSRRPLRDQGLCRRLETRRIAAVHRHVGRRLVVGRPGRAAPGCRHRADDDGRRPPRSRVGRLAQRPVGGRRSLARAARGPLRRQPLLRSNGRALGAAGFAALVVAIVGAPETAGRGGRVSADGRIAAGCPRQVGRSGSTPTGRSGGTCPC